MYFKEHGVPHFHAICGEYNGVFNVTTLEMIEGDLPARAAKMVKDWAKKQGPDGNVEDSEISATAGPGVIVDESLPENRKRQGESLFQAAKAEKHGYAVVWNDEIDLSESEIWIHGAPGS